MVAGALNVQCPLLGDASNYENNCERKVAETASWGKALVENDTHRKQSGNRGLRLRKERSRKRFLKYSVGSHYRHGQNLRVATSTFCEENSRIRLLEDSVGRRSQALPGNENKACSLRTKRSRNRLLKHNFGRELQAPQAYKQKKTERYEGK